MPDENEELEIQPISEPDIPEEELEEESESDADESDTEDESTEPEVDAPAPEQESEFTEEDVLDFLQWKKERSAPADDYADTEGSEEESDPFWDDFKTEFGDGSWLPEEAVTALQERESRQAQVFQQMMEQQTQVFVAMLDQVADKGPAIQRVLDVVANDVPEEFLPVMKEMLKGDSLVMLTNFARGYQDPKVKPELQAFLDMQYGAWKRKEVKQPVGKPPVGIADGGAPTTAPQGKARYTQAQEEEWAMARKTIFKNVTDEKELAERKKKHFA